jgi:hypothetical protein
MSMIKPAFPTINTEAALSDHLVWAALMTDDGANNVRNGGTTDLAFRDLIDPTNAYAFAESFSATEGIESSPERGDSGITLDSNSWARLEAALGGVNFEVPGATGGSETQHWMLAIRLRASGSGTIVHKGRSNISTDLHAYVTSNTLAVAVGNQTLSMNTSGAPYTDGAPFVNGSQDMTLVIASQGATGRFKVTYTGHPQERTGPIGAAAAQLLDPSGDPFPVRLGARATLDDADDDTVTDKHPDLTIYSVQVFRRATVFTQTELLSIANDTYQCFREANHPQSLTVQAASVLDFDKAFCWVGDSQSIENQNRLPHGVKEKYVAVGDVASMFLSVYPQSAALGGSRAYSTPSGMSYVVQDMLIDNASLPASLQGLICTYSAYGSPTANIADESEVINLQLAASSAQFLGATAWSNGIDLEAVLLYATSPSLGSDTQWSMRTERNTTSDLDFTIDYSYAGLKSVRHPVPDHVGNATTFIRLRSDGSGTDETDNEFLVIGGYYEKVDESGNRVPGYGFDTCAFPGFDAAEWLADASAIAFGDKWAHTVIPEHVNIMLGHNQAAGHTTQLDAGDLTGDYTDDITAFVDMVIEGVSAARHQRLDFSTRTSIILCTPWRAAATLSPMDDATNAATVDEVHAALATARNFVHVSMYAEFDEDNPLADGLHPGDGTGDDAEERELVADAWVTQLQSYLPVEGTLQANPDGLVSAIYTKTSGIWGDTITDDTGLTITGSQGGVPRTFTVDSISGEGEQTLRVELIPSPVFYTTASGSITMSIPEGKFTDENGNTNALTTGIADGDNSSTQVPPWTSIRRRLTGGSAASFPVRIK